MNELRFNFTQNSSSVGFESTSLGGATPFDLSSIPGPNGSQFPSVAQGGGFFVCLCYGEFPNFALYHKPSAQRQYNITDTYNWTVARHQLKFGMDWRRLATKVGMFPIGENVIFFSEASVLANSMDFAQAIAQTPPSVEPVYTNFSSFVQDQWKATSRLSLSLGLRWDLNPAPSGEPLPYTVTQISNLLTTQVAPAGTALWRTKWNNLAPRLGMAYTLRQNPSGATVIRAGFGMFYDLGNAYGSRGYEGLGFSSNLSYSGVNFPLTSAQLQVPPPSVAPPYAATVYGFDPGLKSPYTLEWNATVEQVLGAKQALTLNYVGSNGRRLLTQFIYQPGALGKARVDSLK